MERKIGEIFEYNGEWYQCVSVGFSCIDCDIECDFPDIEVIGDCSRILRTDGKSVCFKKLEKVGEPIEFARGLYFQRYQLADSTAFYEGDTRLFFNAPTKTFVYIEIKTKEDMEEKNNAKYSNSEKVGKNLRPFDLQKAREGKPVCTRDGRKARIICFDAKGEHPIIALVTDGVQESPYNYTKEGYYYIEGVETMADLMMLPENKEGWVNVYKGGLLDTKSYPTKKEAFDKACPEGYVDTIKINWSE